MAFMGRVGGAYSQPGGYAAGAPARVHNPARPTPGPALTAARKAQEAKRFAHQQQGVSSPYVEQFAATGSMLEPPAAKRARIGSSEAQAASSPGNIGEIRFADVQAAQASLELNDTEIAGAFIAVELDPRSKDGTKIVVRGLPLTVRWEDLKTHFSGCGQVAFANVKNGKPAVGQVRFETADQAQYALSLNGSDIDGYEIELKIHAGSKDATKLQIYNLPPGFEWQDLKDHFSKNGVNPVFAETSVEQGYRGAEVRFDSPEDAAAAVTTLDQSWLGGGQVNVHLDPSSKDGAKLLVTEIPPGVEWQELKDHFGQVGKVAFADLIRPPGTKGAKGGIMRPGGAKGFGVMAGGFGGCQNPQLHAELNASGLVIGPGGVIMAANSMGFRGKGCAGGGMMMGGGGYGGMMMGGCGGKGGCMMFGGGGAAGPTKFGEIRFDAPESAQAALQTLSGSMLMGRKINASMDLTSHDGTKLQVSGLAPGVNWQELKDHFQVAGRVAFANIK